MKVVKAIISHRKGNFQDFVNYKNNLKVGEIALAFDQNQNSPIKDAIFIGSLNGVTSLNKIFVGNQLPFIGSGVKVSLENVPFYEMNNRRLVLIQDTTPQTRVQGQHYSQDGSLIPDLSNNVFVIDGGTF